MPIRITNINKYLFFVKDNTLIIEEIKVDLEKEKEEINKNKENIGMEIKKVV
tara:strand:+ start:1622 stop:1777 length:156 start_codon:yes stop_codon:yes gene_type:complete